MPTRRNRFIMFAILLITFGVNLMAARQVEAAQTTQFELRPGFEVIDSVSQLRKAMARSGGKIRVRPGIVQTRPEKLSQAKRPFPRRR